MKTQITVIWSAFDRPEMPDSCKASQSVTFVRDIDVAYFNDEILEALFAQTNLYQGSMWDSMEEAGMPAFRTHTALSVGDKVRIERDGDNSLYRCENSGWELLTFEYGKVNS